ncbi:hypothetical protein [Streptomyces sp. NBC_00212]|uniref:hypothetical protein n=1 Tax=Streptomyces sp. NBC_00212 TaxID=2975684 RepID=UPI002F90DBBE
MNTVLNQELLPSSGDDDRAQLRGTPWSVRLSRATLGRAALEIYDGERVVDVVVPTALISATLLGVLSGMQADGDPVTLAWGVFEAGQDAPPDVTFQRGRRWGNTSSKGAEVLIGRQFWLSVAEGRFATATATRSNGDIERRTVLR